MRKNVFAFSFILAAFVLLTSGLVWADVPNEIVVKYESPGLTFTYDHQTAVNYTYSTRSADMGGFKATITNIKDFTDEKLTITSINMEISDNGTVISSVYAAGGGAFTFSLPQEVNKRYQVKYYYRTSNDDITSISPSEASSSTSSTSSTAATPSEITVHYKPTFSGSSGTLKPKLNDTGIEIYGYVQDKSGKTINDAYGPRIEIEGSSIYSDTYDRGYFSLKLNQVSGAGKGALALMFDGIIVYAWDVAAGSFPALRISPGAFQVDTEQSITITAMANDYYSVYSLNQLDYSQLTVEMTGVPIYVNSVRFSPIDSDFSGSSSTGMTTYRRLVLSGNDLVAGQIRFANSGTLKMKITSADGRYESTVDLPVTGSGSSSEGLVGAPPYMSYAGETELNFTFNLSSGRPVREYSATITAGSETVELARSSENSYFYSMDPTTINLIGKGTLYVRATTVDSEYDSRSWTREFSYSRPTITLSQSVIALDEEMTLSVFVRDASGNVVNNGAVFIDGVGSRSSTGSNGEYRFQGYKWTQPGYRRIQAYASDGTLLADFSQLLKVQAPELLTLNCDVSQLMAGADNTLRMTVQDENGREITGARINAYIDGSTTATTATWNSSNKEYTVKVQPWDKVVLRAESSDGRKVSAEMELSVAYPEVKSNLAILTSNYMERLELSFFNPAGEPISGTAVLRSQNLQVADRNVKGVTPTGSSTSSKTGSVVAMDIYCRPLTGSMEPLLIVDFTFGGRTYKELLTIPVGEAKLTVTPTKLMAGVQETVTLEIKGASGKGIPGVNVEFQGTKDTGTGTTNDEGKASFKVTPSSSATSYTLAVTRTDQFVQTGNRATKEEISITVDKDTTLPELMISNLGANNYIEVTENSYVLNLEMKDNVALDTLFINTQPYTLSGTSDTRSEALSLSPGDNKFTLVLRDKAGNQARRDITVRYTIPQPPPVTPPQETQPIVMIIGSTYVTQGGIAMPAPPKAPVTLNGRTMLPFRYLAQTVLGGKVDYVEATETITATVNGHIVQMQVGSVVIWVDGVQSTLDQAPVETDGHTLVPLRAFEKVVSDFGWDPVNFVVTIYP